VTDGRVRPAGDREVSARPPLIGTYTAPAIRMGERVMCLYRDSDCVVASWSNGRISWPRVRALETVGGSGLWVNEELEKAIRTESAAALRCWFGIGAHAVWNWRKAFGVNGCATTPGSRRAIRVAAVKGAAAIKARDWTDEELDRMADAAKQRGTPATGGWTTAQVKLLGTDCDKAIARRIGKTVGAVTVKRVRLKIPVFRDRRRNGTSSNEDDR
jgi:hypothetical protein